MVSLSSRGRVVGPSGFLPTILTSMLCACGGSGSSGDTASVATGSAAPLSAAAALGKQLFFDTQLSASGQQSCSSCHVPQDAYTAGDGRAVPLGGPNMDLPGFRNAPSLVYASYTPEFFFASDGTPTGGFFRDGRATSLADQAQQPFLIPYEMANADAAEVVMRLHSRPYLPQFVALYGATALNDPATALADIGQALAAFEKEDASFHPFSSKFDFFQKGAVTLTAQELRGLALFNDPTRGNCAGCHVSTSANGVTPPLFTDFTYDNIGVPRNATLAVNDAATTLPYVPVNSDDGVHRFYDLGLCGPFRDLGGNVSGFCGQFKVPTLRNIALTAPYFHNGQFATLQDAVGFYVRRDTNPDQWYPTAADGSVNKFDDLPGLYGGQFVVNLLEPGSDAGYVGNVNTLEVPYNRHLGDAPALSTAEMQDVVAFLCTLTDGYDPAHPENYPVPAQCAAATAAAIATLATVH